EHTLTTRSDPSAPRTRTSRCPGIGSARPPRARTSATKATAPCRTMSPISTPLLGAHPERCLGIDARSAHVLRGLVETGGLLRPYVATSRRRTDCDRSPESITLRGERLDPFDDAVLQLGGGTPAHREFVVVHRVLGDDVLELFDPEGRQPLPQSRLPALAVHRERSEEHTSQLQSRGNRVCRRP